MYADLDGTGGLSEKLAQVEIAPIPGRVGQRLRNELIFEARGGGAPLPPEYRLEVAIRENIVSTLTERTGDSRGQVYNLDASFRLISLADKAVVLSGTSYGRAGFERYDSIFSNVRARRDAENRAADTVGSDLKARLSAFLATKA
jgi:LPS-assembly lipoprotein